MTQITISTEDKRSIELLHIRDSRGRCIGYMVPSASEPGVLHTVTPRWV